MSMTDEQSPQFDSAAEGAQAIRSRILAADHEVPSVKQQLEEPAKPAVPSPADALESLRNELGFDPSEELGDLMDALPKP